MEPTAYQAMQPFFALVEAYSFYAMFSLFIYNMGGPAEAIRVMRKNPENVACLPCFPHEPVEFYNRVLHALKLFLWVRVVLITIATIADYAALTGLYVICTLVALGLLIYALVSLVTFYESLMYLDMGHIFKIVILKVSIGLIVFQGIIEMLLLYSGSLDNVQADPGYSQDETIVRYYCFIILVEYVFFSVAVWADIQFTDFPNPTQTSSTMELERISLTSFVLEVFAVHDVFFEYPVDLKVEDTTPLGIELSAKGL